MRQCLRWSYCGLHWIKIHQAQESNSFQFWYQLLSTRIAENDSSHKFQCHNQFRISHDKCPVLSLKTPDCIYLPIYHVLNKNQVGELSLKFLPKRDLNSCIRALRYFLTKCKTALIGFFTKEGMIILILSTIVNAILLEAK